MKLWDVKFVTLIILLSILGGIAGMFYGLYY